MKIHEDDLYDPATDYRVIVYSLKVIGAVQAIAARIYKKYYLKTLYYQ